ncbi:MAG: CSLREA domain-containing protein [Dehalococcoidia bacterium]|nr:CSLREA domain-containing protein [Dehalococcoidia bacterium]
MLLGLAAFSLLGVIPKASAASFAVNSFGDGTDAVPGNNICETAAGNGVCTLRAAIQEANALAGPDTITVPAGTYTLSFAGNGEDAGATSDLDITGDLTITGAGAATTIIDGNGGVTGDRVLDVVGAGVVVQISGVTIKGGAAPTLQNGGGLRNQGQLTVNSVVVTQNSAGVSGDTAGANGGDCAHLGRNAHGDGRHHL